MKLIFMGTPEFAVPSLNKLIKAGHEVLAVFTQPDRPVGRKQIITPPPVKVFAAERGISVHQPLKIKTAEARSEIEPLFRQADAGIVAAYGRILPDYILAAPRLGCINVHSSLLPKYRGAAPINWAIAGGERETGVTIMQMDAGLDTGAMLLQGALEIGLRETAAELTPRLAALGAELLAETLAKLERGEITPIPQNDAEATPAPILKREDGQVDWTLTATEIFNRQRGFTPFPGCYTFLAGQRIELADIAPEPAATDFAPGTVCETAKDFFVVACGGNTQLKVTEVQPAGKRTMAARDFLNGAKLAVGSCFETEKVAQS
ncbi:MAG TPA: methionyl-tRNA formyltransferase [Blastocatellia bacterium]|nr:methionyl-tRNA formyltransferase [Blastocatellia bacterium]HMV84646.1 methionyl-tRNA formyltransferase [Blastocatellia bacterium]HMX27115.1 methionyl-tRNA formyltransferase [Blastocatellia bacterium]HMY74383.1 methionyl-tRNA formyltransferase [Blastocatellia bacterium]HMZ18730.1 methionyl-tRNA formyltransferase [Blastocatellia bacterium]